MFGKIFVFCFVKGVTPLPFLITAWFSAFFVLANYINNKSLFIDDFRIFCKICTYYSLLHIPIMLFLKDALITTNFGMSPKTFLYLFYFLPCIYLFFSPCAMKRQGAVYFISLFCSFCCSVIPCLFHSNYVFNTHIF